MAQNSTIMRQLITDIQTKGWDAKPFERALKIVLQQPELIPELVRAVVADIPRGGTYLDMSLSFLNPADYPEAVSSAIDAYSVTPENKAAESVIKYASLQCLVALHPHLRRIFDLGINAKHLNRNWAWRESGTLDLAALQEIIGDPNVAGDTRLRAWEALLETREAACFNVALGLAADVPFPYPAAQYGGDPVVYYLHQVGYEQTPHGLRQIYPSQPFHLRFPDEYIDNASRPSWRQTSFHPTWEFATDSAADMPFGGSLGDVHGVETKCAVCGGALAHLITFAPVPAGMGVTDLENLIVATCLSCLGWEVEDLYYHHDTVGLPTQINYDEPPQAPQFPTTDVLKACTIQLACTPSRWRWQEWGASNGRENLNRVGGHPSWVQNAGWLTCPQCHKTMTFLLQLDSNLPMSNDSELLWGSGGICYVYWCDACKTSGLMWQCT